MRVLVVLYIDVAKGSACLWQSVYLAIVPSVHMRGVCVWGVHVCVSLGYTLSFGAG